MENYKIYLAGKFVETPKVLEVTNPYDNQVFATTYQAGENELEKAIISAEKTLTIMQNLSSYEKYQILKEISDKIAADQERLATILAQESAKPLIHARAEIKRSIETFLIAAEESKRIPNEEIIRLDWTPAGENKIGIVKQFPIGLVAGISPFNYPINLAAHKIAPAIAAGCPIILKPASATPLSTLELAKIIDQTSLPKGAVSILPMDRTTGNKLVTDPRFKLLSFTGSPLVGWKMKSDAGEKKVVLELGGNAGVIISENAELEKALPRCIMGAFSYSGQICIHAQRFYVHENHFQKFTELMVSGTQKLKSGSPTDPETDISHMIDENNAVRIEEWVNEAISQGAKLLMGGKREKNYYPPTILTNVNPQSKILNEEAFGPVIVIEKFKTFSEAINQINNSKFGLQAGVYTSNINEITQAFNQLHVGGVIINDVPTYRADHMPYGGIKQSGLGREGIRYAMADMLEPRIMVITENK